MLENRAGSPHRMQRRSPNYSHSEVSFGSGRKRPVGYPKAESGSQGAYSRFTPRPSSRTRRVSPPPHEGRQWPSPLVGEGWVRGCSSPHTDAASTWKSRTKTFCASKKQRWPCSDNRSPNHNLTPIKNPKPRLTTIRRKPPIPTLTHRVAGPFQSQSVIPAKAGIQ